MEVLIGSTTAEANAEVEIVQNPGYEFPSYSATIWAWGLDTEEIQIQLPTDKENEWTTVDKLTSDNNSKLISSPMNIRISKPITAAESGVAFAATDAYFVKERRG